MKTNFYIASLATAAAAGIHLAVAPEHFEEWWGFGVFFLVCGVAQLAWAARPSRGWVGVAGNAVLVALWAATRASGFEEVGAIDVVTVALELVAVNRILAGGEWPAAQRPEGDLA